MEKRQAEKGWIYLGKKLFVVEARRLLPLLFLLMLLISLSVYDTFRTSPTVVPEQAAGGGKEIAFTTADKGERKEGPTFRLAIDQEGWTEIAEEWGLSLPQYPFQPQHEVALFALHADVQQVNTQATGETGLDVRVRVSPKRDHYQVVMLPAKDVTLEAGEATWTFVDRKGTVLEQFTMGEITETTIADEVPQK
jgi:hypothetical protein